MDYKLLNGNNLAYIGDAYFELEIRKYLLSKNITKSKQLQNLSVNYVSAKAHALIFEGLKDELTDEEMMIFSRGKNSGSLSHRKNVDRIEYNISTGFEAILGYLYLKNDIVRLEYLVSKAIKIIGD